MADDESDITRQLHENNYGDNWGYAVWHTIKQFADCYSDDRSEWPDGTDCYKPADFPVIEVCGMGGSDFYAADESGIAPSELDHALDYIGHDFHALDVLESREEAESLLERGGHNVPYRSICEAMEWIGWVGDDESEED